MKAQDIQKFIDVVTSDKHPDLLDDLLNWLEFSADEVKIAIELAKEKTGIDMSSVFWQTYATQNTDYLWNCIANNDISKIQKISK